MVALERRAWAGVGAVFFLNGVVFTSFYARLPGIADALELSAGELGLALFGAPIGLLVAQPVVGAVVARRGPRAVIAWAPVLLAAVVLPALAGNGLTLLLAVFALGAGNGALDITMNAQGLLVERWAGRALFSTLHAGFSFGALAGAGLAAAAAGLGLAPLPHLALVAATGAPAALLALRALPEDVQLAPDRVGQARRRAVGRPSRPLVAVCGFAFCALLAEGAVFDWSSVFLVREAGASEGLAALGLAAFSASMGLGRLGVDMVVVRTGPVALARAGGLLAGAGLGGALAAAAPAAAVAGLAVMGLGLAALFPLALHATATGEQRAGPQLAAVSTAGYAGALCGPPVIGLLAQATGLRAALLVVCGLCLTAVALATALAPPRGPAAPATVNKRHQ